MCSGLGKVLGYDVGLLEKTFAVVFFVEYAVLCTWIAEAMSGLEKRRDK